MKLLIFIFVCLFSFAKKKMSSVKLALVVGDGEKDEDVEVIDLTKLQPLSPTIFLIETKPFFKEELLKYGAGDVFSADQIRFLLSSILPPHA